MEKTDIRTRRRKRKVEEEEEEEEEVEEEHMMNEQKKAERMTAQGVGSQSSMLLCSESKNIFRQDVAPGWDAVKHRNCSQFLLQVLLLRQFNKGIRKEEEK